MTNIRELRASIDAIDDELVSLLNRRCEYVQKVGAIKKQTQRPGLSFIRSAREAEMVRRMMGAFRDGPFPALAAGHLWRIIISASLSLEAPMTVAAYCPEAQSEIYWLAREYFGNVTPISKEPTIRRVMGDVNDGKVQVGILPPADNSTDGKWWLKLQGDLKIFACIPFLLPKGSPVKALAIAKVAPEETGNDVSYFSIETEGDVSQSRIKAPLDKHRLEARWITTETFASGHRLHLIEIKGFHTEKHEAMHEIKVSLDRALLAINWLGAYALPVTV